MVATEFSAAINQLAAEKGISVEAVLETVEQALVAAYRKDFGAGEEEEIEVKLDPKTGKARVFKGGKDVTPDEFGRIAAQTAKQVIFRRVREEERSAVRSEFEKKIGSIVSGQVFRIEREVVFVDLGRAQGVLPPSEQIPGEEYQVGRHIKVLVKEVQEGPRGPEVLLSRADAEFVKELFALEVPEISTGVVKVEAIAREPGRRTKMAVSSSEEKVDPVGSCVGQRGVRVQAVTRELGEEKVDIIPYSADPDTFVAAALSPAKVINVKSKKKSQTAEVEVPEDQLSLAIGKGGQNARLAAKLTGWRIDIKGAAEAFAAVTARLGSSPSGHTAAGGGGEFADLGISRRAINALAGAGITSIDQLKSKSEGELEAIKGLGPKSVAEIKKALGKLKGGDGGQEGKGSGGSGARGKDVKKEESGQKKTEGTK